MTGTAVVAPPRESTTLPTGVDAPRARGIGAWLRRPLVAGVLLLLVYATMSFALNDPRGTLGTDTGGKLATLHMMEGNGGLNPNLGYWAQRYDPNGVLQPLHYTYRVDEKWVNVTTLPMIDVAYPLYRLGGDRAVLLLPMLGAVAAALGAAALMRRLAGGDGMIAFWIVGLATPLAIYALDFWEHALGLALMLWAVVLVYDVMERNAGWRGALGAGALFGLAATMRTESLVYFVATVGLACLVMLVRDRNLVRPVVTGLCASFSLFVLLVANRLLEQFELGTDLRATRISGTATGSGSRGSVRIHEAFTTSVGLGLSGMRSSSAWIIGGAIVALLAGGAWLLRSEERVRVAAGGVLLAVAALVYLDRFSEGWGFVPGLLTASPLAAVGIVLAWRMPGLRWMAAVAVVALPIAWASQYSGGADPQWGARYVLLSGALLAIAGIVVLHGHTRALVGVVAVAVLVTAGGLVWLSVRSHTIADGMETILARHDEMLISRQPHMLREVGAFYDLDRKWLTATTDSHLADAVAIARESGVKEFALIGGADQPAPAQLGGYRRGSRQLVPFLRPDVKLGVVTYRLS